MAYRYILFLTAFLLLAPGLTAAQQSAGEWIEIAVFVHGITPDKTVEASDPYYEDLNDNLRYYWHRLADEGQLPYPFDAAHSIYINYGFLRGDIHDPDHLSDYMAAVQQRIGEQDEQIWKETEDYPPSLMRSTAFKKVREVMLYGISDAFYYNSLEGTREIWGVIIKQIRDVLVQRGVLDSGGQLPEGRRISLTIFAHSMGAIVMYDILRSLYGNPNAPQEALLDAETQQILNGLVLLRKAGRVRVRHYITFGTQISVMYLKYERSLQNVMDGKLHDLSSIFPATDKVPDPRWINFWDKDDILGYPFAFLFEPREKNRPIIVDVHVDAGDYLPHVKYWSNTTLAIEAVRIMLGLSTEEVERRLR